MINGLKMQRKLNERPAVAINDALLSLFCFALSCPIFLFLFIHSTKDFGRAADLIILFINMMSEG